MQVYICKICTYINQYIDIPELIFFPDFIFQMSAYAVVSLP